MELYLVHTQPNLEALTAWATRRHWLSPDGDLGYALHALLAEAFDGAPPVPYRYMGEQGLLAYSTRSPDQLQALLAMAPTETRRIVGAQHLRARTFPADWPVGKHLGFEVRLRPVIRTNKAKAERDLYQYRMEQWPADTAEPSPSREAVYRDWLDQRLISNGARLLNASMREFRLRQVVRRPQMTEQSSRRPRTVTGPEAVFGGELEVRESSAFGKLLAGGLGRHRAFGYGMLMLKPAAKG